MAEGEGAAAAAERQVAVFPLEGAALRLQSKAPLLKLVHSAQHGLPTGWREVVALRLTVCSAA